MRKPTLRLAALRPREPTEEVAMQYAQEGIEERWKEYKATEDGNLRNKLVTTYMPLVRYMAEKLRARLPQEVDIEDLMHAGVFGLIDAGGGFDLKRGGKFE